VQGFHHPVVGEQRDYKGMTDAFVKIYQREGVKGLYRGLIPNYLKVIPAIATSFLVFEECKKQFDMK
jgi:solute carrier family 25 phosphate transporter 23/24/25/41